MFTDTPQGGNLFLTAEDRKPVEASSVAAKATAKAPQNLAIYENDQPDEVIEHVKQLAILALGAYQNQWQSMKDKWDKADEYYWMAQKDSRLTELTNAKVSASVFHRTARRLADGAYLASFSEEMPVKLIPDIDTFLPSAEKVKQANVANVLNDWARSCMRKTKLKEKAKDAYHKVYKYANLICRVPYDYEIESRTKWETYDPNQVSKDESGQPTWTHFSTGEVSNQPHPMEMRPVQYDYVCKDEVGFYPLPIESCYLDQRIEDLDRQTIFMWRSDMTRPEIWAQAKAGHYLNVERITELNKFQQYGWTNNIETQRITDAGKTTTDSWNTEVYERWQCWMLLPKIKVKTNKKGDVTDLEWDQNGESRRYVLELVGPLNGTCTVVRFSESPYWSNGIPFIAAHSHADDSGFYHRGLQELLEDNMAQEQTAKGQLMDCRTLMTRRPMTRLVGGVKQKDIRITQNTVFDLYRPDALKQLEVSDISPTIHQSLEFLKSESESIAQTPSFFMGDSMGARTSATEFSSIRDQSSAPALNDIKTLNMMIAGGYIRKVKEYAPQFFDKDVAVKLAGPNGEEAVQIVSADDFNADMLLQDVAVQDFENKTTVRQVLMSLSQVVSNPVFAPFINVAGYLERIFKTFSSVFPNPEEIINKNEQTMAVLQAYLSQNPPKTPPSPQTGPGMPPGAQNGPPMGLPNGMPPQGMPPQGMPPQGPPPMAGRVEGQMLSAPAGAAGGM